MAKYFTVDEFELAKEFFKEYPIYCDGLGPWGEKTGDVISIGNEDNDAYLDIESFNYFGLEGNKLEELKDEPNWYISDLESIFDINIKDFVDPDELVVFNCRTSQACSNCLTWEQCIGDLYCDDDDFNEFVEKHEEYQTKEWKIERDKSILEDMGLDVEDLKKKSDDVVYQLTGRTQYSTRYVIHTYLDKDKAKEKYSELTAGGMYFDVQIDEYKVDG